MHAVSKQPGQQLCLALNVGAANTTNDRCNLHLSETCSIRWTCRGASGKWQRQGCQRKTRNDSQWHKAGV